MKEMNKKNIESIFELSPMQQGMLFHTLYSANADPYVYQYTARIKGNLNVTAFKQAWQEVMNRHQVLRTSFYWQEVEKPLQVVYKRIKLPLSAEHWSSLSESEQQERLEAYLQSDRERGFDLSKPPLLRLSLIHLGHESYQFVWSFHHILLDGWSVTLLLKEVFVYYEAFRQHKELDELPRPRPYGDYIAWLQQDLTKAEQFWRRTLEGFITPTSLPFDSGLESSRGEDIHDAEYTTLSADTTAALRALARQHQLTLNTLMQGVWGILLSRYTGATDIVFGSVVSGRPHDLNGAESMVGLFINTLPTRIQVEPEATLVSWLKKLQVEQFEARQYEYSPLVQVQRWSEVPRTRPLFEYLMVFENFPVNNSGTSLIGDLEVEMARSFEQNSYPLAFVVMPYAEMILAISYSRPRFDKAVIAQMLADLQALLNSIVAHPEQNLAALPSGNLAAFASESVGRTEKIADLYRGSNLTQDQLVMWVGQELQPKAAVYNMTHAFSIFGEVSVKHFQAAFQTLLNSSDALRTVIDEKDGVPFQRGIQDVPYVVECIDFSQFDEPARLAGAWIRKRCQAPLDFEKRLFDTALLKTGAAHYIWYLNIHHIVADAWSHSLIFRYTAELYEQSLAGLLEQSIKLPSFRDFVRAEQEERHSAKYREAEDYWQRKLSVACEPIKFYGGAPLTRSTRVERSLFNLGRERTQRLEELALKEGIFVKSKNVTLFNIFTAVLFTYLHRVSGNERLSLGTPFHNRHTAELRNTIGMLMRMQPLRINVEAGDTLRTLVQKVSADASEARKHQQSVVENPSHNRVFDVILNFHNAVYPNFHGAMVATEWVHSGDENISFALQVHDFNLTGNLNLYFDLHCDIFNKEQRAQVMEHFTHVLDSMLEDEGRLVSTITLPSEMKGTQPSLIDALSEQSNLTQGQLSFWLAQQLQPELPLFNMASLVVIAREIDRQRFASAIQTLIKSSDALRTVIEVIDGLPQQRVVSSLPFELDYLDFSHLPDPPTALRSWAEERSRGSFNLDERMFDSALVKLSEEKYGWFINHHQIVSDAWSSGVIVQRVSEIYGRAWEEGLPDVVELPLFKTYVALEAENRHSSRYRRAEAYWKEKREHKLEPIEFYGEPTPPVTARVLRVPCQLGFERSKRLKAIAELKEVSTKGFDMTMFSIFTALLFTYMYRISGNRALVLATPLHNRNSPAFKETIGMFMEVVPLQLEIASDETFLSLIKKVSVKFFEVARHRGYPVRNSAQDKVYDVCLNYLHVVTPSFAGAQVESLWIHPGAGNETLTLQVHDFDQTGNFVVDFDFDCEVFDEERRPRVIDHFLKVLDSFLEDYTRSVQSFSVLTAGEQQVLLKDFNKRQTIVPHDQTLPQLFEAQVRLTPNNVAVTYQDDSLTYAQLNSRANRLARYLRASDVGPEDVVALLGRRTPDLLAAILAVMKAGAAYLPLNPSDPSQRHARLVLQSGSVMALAAGEFLSGLSGAIESVHPAQRPPVNCLEESLQRDFNEEDLPTPSVARNLAYVIYTSGSTGEPKGAMLEQAGMINHIFAKIKDLDLRSSDVTAQTASQCFDISVWQFLAALVVGGRVHIVKDELTRDPIGLLNEVTRAGVTVLETVPSLLRGMTDELDVISREGLSLSQLRWMLVTGEALEPELCRNWFEIYPSVPLLNAYGPTECSDDVSHFVVDAATVEEQRCVPIGYPVSNMRLYVLDGKLYPVPQGVAGELYVGGIGVGRGYLNDPAQTAEAFIPDPFGPDAGARLYRTGDLVRHRLGNLEFLGRIDHQVKVRGHRIELREIEAVLQKHAAVRQSLVIAREETPGQKQLVAYVVGQERVPVNVTELREFLKESLPEYMIPAAFVVLDAVPLNANGKVDRKALPEPERVDLVSEETYLAPRNVLELQLAQIWQAILAVEQVGVRDNFFDLGGHSLLAVRLIAQIRKRIGQELPLATLIEAATIERLAAFLSEQDAKRQRSPLVSIQPKGTHTPFFCVHPGSGNVLCYLSLAQRLGSEWPFYGLQDPNTLEDPEQQSTSNFELPLETMAAQYLEAVRAVQPKGPYLLGGWSFGGFVAYEMAQQLRNRGEEVSLLAILDTGPVFEIMRDADDARLLAILCEESGLIVKAEDLRALSAAEQLNYVAQQLKAARLVPSDIPVSRISRSVNIFKARIKVATNYELKTYDGPITLFRAGELEADAVENGAYLNDPTMGWGNFTRHGVEVHTVPGTHATMAREPNVQVLASTLKLCLEQAVFELISDRP
jgi:amino acid adenylation domain-containing protein